MLRRETIDTGNGESFIAFIWCGNKRWETRNGTGFGTGFGTVVNQFFGRGEMIAGSKYFYVLDHLGSVRELTDSTGAVRTRYSYDPYGQVTQTFVSETVASDFQYAGYYLHAPSGLGLTRTRAYNASIGRFITRDPIGEIGNIESEPTSGNAVLPRMSLKTTKQLAKNKSPVF